VFDVILYFPQAETLCSNLFQVIVLERVSCFVMDTWVKLEGFTSKEMLAGPLNSVCDRWGCFHFVIF